MQASTTLIPTREVGAILSRFHTFSAGTYDLKFTQWRSEGAGTIAELGEGNVEFKIGDQVAFLGPQSYAEFVAVDVANVIKIPQGIDLQVAAGALLQGMTAVVLATDAYQVRAGDWVLVPAAAGGVGSLLCQLCNQLGATVIGLVSSAEKAEIAKANGAHHIIDYTENPDFDKEVLRLTGGCGVQVVFDGVGKAIYSRALNSLAKRGVYLYFGNAGGMIDSLNPFDLAPKCISFMRPTLFRYVESAKEFHDLASRVFDLILTGKVPCSCLRYP